ncbi:hypothetical protein Dred_0972 [Desulforamulus reducens MI-1]|uniref:Uncharacterized protein n=1 Tax=Desulforamulus reducens (strain ATCC BAA-1160 / DSM 100696 / MI-1) TaxID=349161 RepID=A4J354_DESRM|nr:hypothetical protein Dred_0972 [Desulforamulus reducens MI-1]
MAKSRPGRRVEFRLPEDHPFFTVVPLGERQDWLAEKITAALETESVKVKTDPDKTIQRIEEKIDQILGVMASGISISGQTPTEQPKQEEPIEEKPKPAVKNPRALLDF